jgi:serine/threonine protein kinase
LCFASDLGVSPSQLLFAEGDSCEEFEGWLRLRKSGISVDFRRLLRFGSDHLELRSYLFEDSVIEDVCQKSESSRIESRLCRGIEDDSQIVIHSIFLTGLNDNCLIEKEIGNLINLCHPCIAGPICFIFGSGSQELKVVGLSSTNFSLGDIERENPGWWTPTAKAKAVAGLVLGLRFAHSLGFIHGHLTTNSILFDLDHRIQITDFESGLSGKGIYGFSREQWNPEMDVRGFVSILFEIVVGRPVKDEKDIPADIPNFVSEMIKTGLSDRRRRLLSFRDIFEILKRHNFEIMSGVDSGEVSIFVEWVEFLEQSR